MLGRHYRNRKLVLIIAEAGMGRQEKVPMRYFIGRGKAPSDFECATIWRTCLGHEERPLSPAPPSDHRWSGRGRSSVTRWREVAVRSKAKPFREGNKYEADDRGKYPSRWKTGAVSFAGNLSKQYRSMSAARKIHQGYVVK